MPNINLIAARREEKKRLERLARQLFFGLAASVGVLGSLTLFMGAQQLTMGGDLRETESRMHKLQPTLDEIARIKNETAEVTPKVDTLQAAKTGTQRWRAVLQVVAGALPNDTWLSALSATGANEDLSITLTGISSTQTIVGQAMTSLGSHPLFDRVELRFTQNTTPPMSPPQPGVAPPPTPSQRFMFEIAAHLRGAPTAPPKADDAKAAAGGQKTAQANEAAGGKNNG